MYGIKIDIIQQIELQIQIFVLTDGWLFGHLK
jgi:hypothetical protein